MYSGHYKGFYGQTVHKRAGMAEDSQPKALFRPNTFVWRYAGKSNIGTFHSEKCAHLHLKIDFTTFVIEIRID